MTFEIRVAREGDSAIWNDIVEQSPQGTIFHRWEWLKIAEIQSNTRFFPAMVYQDSNLVALYPVFIQRRGPINIAFSPPPHTYMLYLGPVLVGYECLKQDKRESLFSNIQQHFDEYCLSELNCKFIRIRSGPAIYDSRPLRWSKYRIEPYYTYVIDLTEGADAVWNNFDRKLRIDIRKAYREGVEMREGDEKDLPFIHSLITQRFLQQGYKPREYLKYLNDLYDVFHPAHMKIFLGCRRGEVLSGLIALFYKERAYLWIGIPKNPLKGISVNDLIQWEAIKWAAEHGYRWYEEMDSGDDRRLTRFKSKYNPDIQIWFSAERSSSAMIDLISSLFRCIRGIAR